MDLKEYLDQSKNKRVELVKQASRYLQKVMNADSDTVFNKSNKEDLYYGPKPLKLKEFETSLNSQLQKIHKIGFDAVETHKSVVMKNISINERIKRIYSKDAKNIKRKQLTILPKNSSGSNVKVILPLKESRFMNNSPYLKQRKSKKTLNNSSQNISLPSINSKSIREINN